MENSLLDVPHFGHTWTRKVLVEQLSFCSHFSFLLQLFANLHSQSGLVVQSTQRYNTATSCLFHRAPTLPQINQTQHVIHLSRKLATLTMISTRTIVLSLTALTCSVLAENAASPVLRGSKDGNDARILVPHPTSDSQPSTYQGCLSYSQYQLKQMWTFPGQAPDCSWYNYDTGSGGSGSSGGSSSGGSNGGSSNGGSSSSGGSSGSSGGSSSGGSSNGSGSSGGGGDGSSNSGGNGGSGNDAEQNYEDVVDAGGDPFSDFDIEVCESYENLWLWDLSLSCNSSNVDDALHGCNCTFAAEMFYEGQLTCDDASLCPRDCSICTTCLSLLGCDVSPETPLASELIKSKMLLYLIAAGIAMVIIMMAAYYSRRRKDREDLKTSLMAEQNLEKFGTMYINADLPWQPPSSLSPTDGTAASTLQPSNTTSFEDKPVVQPFRGGSLLGNDDRSTSDSNEDSFDFGPATTSDAPFVQTTGPDEGGLISPISTPAGSLDGEEGDDELENSQESSDSLDDSLGDCVVGDAE